MSHLPTRDYDAEARRPGAGARAASAVALALLTLALAPLARSQEACDGAVERAEEAYYGGEFDRGIDVLGRCLDEGRVPRGQLEGAYALLGRLHFAKGNQGGARSALQRLFAHAPAYRADPAQEEPAYLALVEEVRQEAERAAAERAQARRDSLARVAAERATGQPGQQAEPPSPRRRSPLPWVLAGVGAAAAGAAVFLLGGDDDEPPQNACQGPTVLTDVEPNGPSLPQVLSATNGPPIRLTGQVTLEPALDEDFYSVRITEPGISVTLTELSADAQLYFGDFDEIHLASEQPGTADEAIHANLPPGTYFIHVFPFQFGVTSISYTLNVIGAIEGCSTFRVEAAAPTLAAPPVDAARYMPAHPSPSEVQCEAPNGIAMAPGWNTIRNASDRVHTWADVRAHNAIGESLWFAEGAWRADSLFRAGLTYHVFNGSGLSCLRLPPAGFAADEAAPADQAMELSAALPGGPRTSVRIRLAHDTATPTAVADVAPPFGIVPLELTIRDESLPADLRRLKQVTRQAELEGHTFPLILDAPAGSLVHLRLRGWDGTTERAVLAEVESGRVHEVGSHGVAHVLTDSRSTAFVLAVGTSHYVDAALRSMEDGASQVALASPNPFRSATTVRYTVGAGADSRSVGVEILNLLGQRVRTLVAETQAPGDYEVTWDGTDGSGAPVPSAIYLCRIMIGDKGTTLRMTRAL